jgi:hypothetical protein
LLWLSTELRVLPVTGMRLFAPYFNEEFNGTARATGKAKKSLRKIQSCSKTGSGKLWFLQAFILYLASILRTDFKPKLRKKAHAAAITFQSGNPFREVSSKIIAISLRIEIS